MADFIVIIILIALLFAACYKIYKNKKTGASCMGCADKGSCQAGHTGCQKASRPKKNEKKSGE